MNKEFKTVKGTTVEEIDIKKSKFITTIKRCDSEEESIKFIEEISKENWSATHNCWAYVNGATKIIQRYSDDGEPQGTAGIPMLEVLLREDLTNVAVVVTRYYGGVKLGAAGLIRAYSGSVSSVIKSSKLVRFESFDIFKIKFDYTYLGKIDNYITEKGFIIDSKNYSENVEIVICSRLDEVDNLKNSLMEITSANIDIKYIDTALLEIEI